ncbi:uncharacterized protein LOC128860781 isoform X2 [Anastrepha ludens]|uniref:uncharacterized protein LOC128860781 isoform X2 n=1 Tax=Anastrepha ludens TaxID=28586 RepID=UPI0023AFE0FE|nr:uncharacterized protein LOC128860781 isoform X2 [Anastrepha ludens]
MSSDGTSLERGGEIGGIDKVNIMGRASPNTDCGEVTAMESQSMTLIKGITSEYTDAVLGMQSLNLGTAKKLLEFSSESEKLYMATTGTEAVAAPHTPPVKEVVSSIQLREFEELGVDQSACLNECNSDLKIFKRWKGKRLKFWSKELYLKRKSVRRLRRLYQRAKRANSENSSHLRDQFKNGLNEYKKMLNKAKEEAWKRSVGYNSHDSWKPNVPGSPNELVCKKSF